jgi:hypothetical protein
MSWCHEVSGLGLASSRGLEERLIKKKELYLI